MESLSASEKVMDTTSNDSIGRKSRCTEQKVSGEDGKLNVTTMPVQMHRKAVKKGLSFTIIVVGESGLGKSTFINTLFSQEVYKSCDQPSAQERVMRTTEITKRLIELDDHGVKLRLTLLDTPGFSDALNAKDCWQPIEQYIDDTFDHYFKDECGLNRKNISDNRVHCCLYFISPYGHSLRPIDVEFLCHLHHKVNIVPVIAKADCLTTSELRRLKSRILADLARWNICVYKPALFDENEVVGGDEEVFRQQDEVIRAALPFAVIGSNSTIDLPNGQKVRGRQYPWGVVNLEDDSICDFNKLRTFLLRTHIQDLMDITRDVHYENYRTNYISQRMAQRHPDRASSFGIPVKSKRDSSTLLDVVVVTESKTLLQQKEEEIQRMKSMLAELRQQLVHEDAATTENGTSNCTDVQA